MRSKNKFFGLFITMFLLIVLSSCATKQWYQAESECTTISYQYYPPNNQKMLITTNNWIDVADDYNCQKFSNTKESCNVNNKKIIPKQYQSHKDVDVNTEARNRYIRFCIAEVCKQRYGNSDCEIR